MDLGDLGAKIENGRQIKVWHGKAFKFHRTLYNIFYIHPCKINRIFFINCFFRIVLSGSLLPPPPSVGSILPPPVTSVSYYLSIYLGPTEPRGIALSISISPSVGSILPPPIASVSYYLSIYLGLQSLEVLRYLYLYLLL